MTDQNEKVEDENLIETVIADDIEFKGTLEFKTSLKIKGNFEGKIKTDGHLIIGREASINADIEADKISISGRVSGKIKTMNKIELFKKSITNSDLITPELYMEAGSIFNGTCLMDTKLK